MRRATATPVRVLALATAAALVLAACGSSKKATSNPSPTAGGSSGAAATGGTNTASAPGITATEVKIGSHQPLTGPAAPGYSEIAPASNAYFKYVNAHGGVYGRSIIYDYKDDGYNPATTSTVVKQLVLQDHVFAIFTGLGTPTHSAVVDYLNANKVPDVFVASGCTCWDKPTTHPETFGLQPDYLVEAKILGTYTKQHFPGKKIGFFLQSDDVGANATQGLNDVLGGQDVVSRQGYTPTNVDVGPQVEALKAAGAQVVISFSIPAFTALERLTMLKLGYTPQLVVSNIGTDPITLTGLLKAFSKGAAGGSLINGIVTDGWAPPLADTANSWVALFKKIHDQYDSSVPFDGNVEVGMVAAATFVAALRAAGRNPTRADFVHAIETSDINGPNLIPFRFSAKSHAGATGAQVGIITNGAIVLQGKPQTTDDGNGPVVDYTGAQKAAPANG